MIAFHAWQAESSAQGTWSGAATLYNERAYDERGWYSAARCACVWITSIVS